MKKHAIIPIFIPHNGCNNDCVFCNQKIITARSKSPDTQDVIDIIEKHLTTIDKNKIETIEVAFYGGSFTGLDISLQNKYLEVAKKYKLDGKIHKIHLSTRPDYVDETILVNLKKYYVDIIELGVQSFDKDVLTASKRGHSVEDVYRACELIKNYGFTLGIQLMIGLPKDNFEKSIFSANQLVQLKPAIARLYPTMVLPDTELLEMLNNGTYVPLSEDKVLNITKEMYKIIDDADIQIIRVGLKSTDLINDYNIKAGNYHPAFRQIVESAIALERIDSQISNIILNNFNVSELKIYSNSKHISSAVGHKKSNKNHLENKYPNIKFRFLRDEMLRDNDYRIE
ncbi:MAG: radical SAM protein [Eubacteriales bacterium]|nr:radical SAM protein [Eubacteriales bacterium]MDY3332634.1 radical SAM protein [Gallibacter sp.]